MKGVFFALMVLGLLSIPFKGYGFTLQDIQSLSSQDKKVRAEALSRLIDARDPSTYPVLEAINQNKLYLYMGRLVTLGEKDANSNKDIYEVLALYPNRMVLKDGSGKPIKVAFSGLKPISFSRKDRLAILPLLPYINLESAYEETRKMAYTQFQNTIDIENFDVIKNRTQKEIEPDMVRYAQETLLTMELYGASSENDHIEAAIKLRKNKGDNSVQILQTFMEKANLSQKAERQIQKQVALLEQRSERIVWIQNLFSGLSLGSILILISLGLAIIYGLAGVINMAHGEFLMIGAYTTFCMQQLFSSVEFGQQMGDVFFWISLPLSFVVAGLFGLLIERFIIRKLYGKPLQGLLATWGVSLVLIQLARTVFGDLTSVTSPKLLSGGWQVIPQLVLPYNRLFVIGVTLIMILLVVFFLNRTRYGLRIRSVTQNRSMSACLGISTKKIDALTFFVGSGIAGVAGCCMTLIGNIVPDMGQTYIVDSFLVVVTGGVGNLAGTIVSGLGIGFLTKILEPTFQTVFGKVIILALIIFFIQFKPQGIFPAKGRIAQDTDL